MNGKAKVGVSFLLIAILLFGILNLHVFANSPPPASSITISFTNLPADAVYADLLIKINETDKNFTYINTNKLNENNLSEDSEIIKYNEGSYKSFTFHYKDSKSTIKLYNSIWDNDQINADFLKGWIMIIAERNSKI